MNDWDREGTPPQSPPRARKEAAAVAVAVTAESSYAPVYAVRSPGDLESIRDITRPRSEDALGEYFVGQGVITSADLREALTIQRHSVNRRLGWILCTLGHLERLELDRLLAAHYGIPCVTLEHYRPSRECRQRLPGTISGDGRIAVLHEDDGRAWVAVSDVSDGKIRQDAAAWLKKEVLPIMAPREEIARYLGNAGSDPGLER